jgi:hypothetical protein
VYLPEKNGEQETMKRKEVLAMARELIVAGRKQLAKKYHPDVGGSDSAMRTLNEISAWLQAVVTEQETRGKVK